MKTCTNCQVPKPLVDFYMEKRVADGRQAQCKECMRKRKQQQRLANPTLDKEFYHANKDRLRQERRDRYKSPEVRAKERQQQREYYLKNRERLKAKVKAYAEANKAKISAYQKERRKHPDHVKAANERSRKYRANPENKAILAHRQMQYTYRKLNAKGFSTKQQLQWRWEYYGGRCWICECEAKEFDHVIPLTKGGSNWPANLRPICRSCNARKSNTWPYNPKPLLQGVN